MEVSRRLRTTEVAIFAAVLLECIVFAFLSPSFLTLNNFVNVTLQIAIYGILAVGMTIIMITGGIDLSIGSVVALVGVVAAILSKKDALPADVMVWTAMLAGIALGTAIGAASGSLIARFGIPPFIVTLALMTICRGVVFIITGGFTEGELPAHFGWLGRGHLWFLPIPVVIMVLLFGAGYVVLDMTAFGRHIYALGGNEEAARLSGIGSPVQDPRLCAQRAAHRPGGGHAGGAARGRQPPTRGSATSWTSLPRWWSAAPA